jgi:hypothetical protein
MQAWAGDHQYIGYVPGQGVLINQARIGVELGSTPWTTVPFRAPTSELRLASFGVPVGPPYEAESQPTRATQGASIRGGRVTRWR